jgi:hypothetical protein
MNDLMQSAVTLKIDALTKTLIDNTVLEFSKIQFEGNIFALTEFLTIFTQTGDNALSDEAFQEFVSSFLAEDEDKSSDAEIDIEDSLIPVKTQRGKERPMNAAVEVNSETPRFDDYPNSKNILEETSNEKKRLGS